MDLTLDRRDLGGAGARVAEAGGGGRNVRPTEVI
jgi:hypothetical protein